MISYFHCRLLALIASIVFLFDGVQATRDQDQLELVRNEYGDYFENVFSSGPTDTNETFCRSLNAFCMNKYPSKDDKCRYCQCSGLANTYVEQRAQCEQTEAVKKGCILQFYKGNNYYVNVINIDDDGKLELLIPGLVKHNHIKKCVVENVAQMTPNGYNKVTKTLFEVDKTDDGKKKVKIEWDELEKSYGGRLYRINITCEMEKHEAGGPREKYTMTQCVVLKTRGRISVKNPSLPISPTQLSTTVTWTTGDPTTTEHTSSEAPVTEAPTTPTTKAPTKAPTKGHRTTGELMTTMIRTTLEVHPSTKKVASQARTVETTVTSTLELIPSDLISRSTKGSSLRTSAGVMEE